MAKPIVSMTQAARSRARHLLDTQGQGAEGIKLSVKPTGCSGYSYMMDFASEIGPGDEVVDIDGVRLVVDPNAVMYVLGTEIDFREDRLGAQFVFTNPNEKSRCGCGESFSI